MEEWIFEIETKNKVRRVKNPRKARSRDLVFFTAVEVMDGDGKWIRFFCQPYSDYRLKRAVSEINRAIEEKKSYVNVDDYI